MQPEEPEMDHTATIPAGRIVHDERGNARWKWRGDDTDSNDEPSGVLKHIDPADLARCAELGATLAAGLDLGIY